MSTGFVLHVWGDERGDKRLKAYAPDLKADDLRPLVVEFHTSQPCPEDHEMLDGMYKARPGCEAVLARLFNVEPVAGRYRVGSARWQRPEPDDVLRRQHDDWVKGKIKVGRLTLEICVENDDGVSVSSTSSNTLKPAEVIPYLLDVDVEDDPRLEGGGYLVRPGEESTVAVLFGVEPVEGQYIVAMTSYYEDPSAPASC